MLRHLGKVSALVILNCLGAFCYPLSSGAEPVAENKPSAKQSRTIQVALVQFDSIPEKTQHNLQQMERLVRSAVERGARWVMFHEGCLTDYTPRLDELAESVPDGPSCQRMIQLAEQVNAYLSFGMSERDDSRRYITQVFVGPTGFIYKYRKSWLWRSDDVGYRNEWARYDTGTGPEAFEFDGVRATCFICADGNSARCLERARLVKPEVTFYPNNRAGLPDFPEFGAYAKQIGAPMLVTNRIGMSWNYNCQGGCVVYDNTGNVLAKANRKGKEEILLYNLTVD